MASKNLTSFKDIEDITYIYQKDIKFISLSLLELVEKVKKKLSYNNQG